MHWATNVSNKLERMEQTVSGLCMLALVITVLWGIVERYILKMGSGWPDELSRYLCIYAMMVGSGLAAARGAHVGVEVFVRTLSPNLRRKVEWLAYAASLIFTIALASVGFEYFGRLLRTMQRTPTIEFPIAYAYLAIPVGAVLMTLHYLLKLIAFRAEHSAPDKEEAHG